MYEALITTGNRVTVPRPVREEMGMKPGDIIGFVPAGDGFRLHVVGKTVGGPEAGQPRAPKGPAKRMQR